jgi:CRISPR-associated protein Cmr6
MNTARDALEPVMPLRGKVDSHPGLLLQRYLRATAARETGDPQEKRGTLDAAIRAAQDETARALYAEAFQRWAAHLNQQCRDVPPDDLRTGGRLIVGLGSENVLESGICLHHTYGVPILPGSALKGLAAHYCDHVWGERERPTPSEDALEFRSQRKYHRLLFGDTGVSGCVIFHDAWFVPDSAQAPLKLDVMTPHHPEWNDLADPVAPTDFDSPIPVPFLSVAGAFRVAVSWHGPPSDHSKNWTELTWSLLCDALRHWGIGGKTTSGYGRLVPINSANVDQAGPTSQLSPDQPPNPTPPRHPDQVTVKVLERRDIAGKVQFFVQEQGKPRGVLAYGVPPPPEKLPQVGDEITVYRNNQDARNPQYRWDKPITHRAHLEGGRGPRPRGRR